MTRRLIAFLTFAAAACVVAPPAHAQGLSAEEAADVRRIIRDELVSNPEVLREALDILEERERKAAANDIRARIAANRDLLGGDDSDPTLGNPDGAVTVTVFFDYNCPYCREATPELMTLIDEDPRVRLVLKELPILSDSSYLAARMALAVWDMTPDKYRALHNRLMDAEDTLDEAAVREAVEAVDLDWGDVSARADDRDILNRLDDTVSLARRLGLGGTPAFVVGQRMIPGFTTTERLAAAVDAAANGVPTDQ